MIITLTYDQRRELAKLEDTAHEWAEEACNTDVSEATHEARNVRIAQEVQRILGGVPAGFFWNGDPRGFALKIDPERGGKIPKGMVTDWGGYGLPAHPETESVEL